MTVMTFNIRQPTTVDRGRKAWVNRRTAVAELIRTYSGGIVGLQETLPEAHRDLQNLLGDRWRWYGGRRADGADEEWTPILYDGTRFSLDNAGQQWISDTPHHMSRLPGAARNRIVTWGRFTEYASDLQFLFFNVHLDHVRERTRRRSVPILTSIVEEVWGQETAAPKGTAREERHLPVIVAGDFNTTPKRRAYRAVTNRWRDARSAAHHARGPAVTFTNFGSADQLLDYIFVSNEWTVHTCETVAVLVDGHLPSDHHPVTADLTIA